MKVLTSFSSLVTGEGERIAFTYSEVDEDGKIISQNNKGNFVLTDGTALKHLNSLKTYISNKLGD